jgi:hypothetical protein
LSHEHLDSVRGTDRDVRRLDQDVSAERHRMDCRRVMPSQSQIEENVRRLLERNKAQAELPVEHELEDDARYMDRNYSVARWYNNQWSTANGHFQPVYRLGKVARYEPPKPEVAEPTGLGAVVREPGGLVYVRTDNEGQLRWWNDNSRWTRWDQIPKPVEVLSEGVEL